MSTTWLHTMDGTGRTPLERAFACGHIAMAETLLGQEQVRVEGTPLHRACKLGLSAAVRTLLRFAANPASRDAQGETPLHVAAREGHLETVHILLEESTADPNAACDRGLTAMHWAAITGRRDLFELLLAHGADPWLRGEYLDGLNAVEIATSMGYSELEELLELRLMVA